MIQSTNNNNSTASSQQLASCMYTETRYSQLQQQFSSSFHQLQSPAISFLPQASQYQMLLLAGSRFLQHSSTHQISPFEKDSFAPRAQSQNILKHPFKMYTKVYLKLLASSEYLCVLIVPLKANDTSIPCIIFN